MKKTVAEQASPALNRGGVKAGSPIEKSSTNKIVAPPDDLGTSMPAYWKELKRRADDEMLLSNQLKRALKEAAKRHEEQLANRKPSNYTLSSPVFSACHWAWLLAVLALLMIILILIGSM